MNDHVRVVALIDSGLGALTVLGAFRALDDSLDIVYFADTAHVPYGDRPLAEVAGFGYAMIRELQAYQPASIVVASGTTCAAFEEIGWPAADAPLVGTVEPGARAAVAASRNQRIGMIATTGTVTGGVFERAIAAIAPTAEVVPVAAPSLVPIVESGRWATPEAKAEVAKACAPFIARGCDTVILGCTHFPLLRRWFAVALGDGVTLVDPAAPLALDVVMSLGGPKNGAGSVTFLVSGDPGDFAKNASALMGVHAQDCRQVRI